MDTYLTNEILETKSAAIRAFMDEKGIAYEWYEHKPVLSYEDAEEVAAEVGYTGTESKSLFLRGKKTGGYYIFFTVQGEKMDAKLIKELTGEKTSVCSGAEMQEVLGCFPGCVSPFGHEDSVTLIIDELVYDTEKLVFSPGVPNKTVVIRTADLKTILDAQTCRVLEYKE